MTSSRDNIDLRRVGYDDSGETPRSASFMLEDDTTRVAASKERKLVMASIRQARVDYPWVRKLEWSLVNPEADEFTRLVAEHPDPAGNFIHVKDGAKIRFPAQSCFLLKSQRQEQVLHNVIVLEPGSELHLITGCTAASYDNMGRHIAVTEIFVRNGATLTYTMVHDWAPEVEVRPRTGIAVERGGTYLSNYIALTRVKHIDMNPFAIVQSGGTARFNSIVYAKAGSFFDIGGRIDLRGGGSRGEIVSRVVATASSVISRGLIEGGAEKTKGHMECNGIMLDDKAVIHAIPELKATSPDTELSHEAAVGKIAGEQLNYLMSRGLTEEQARALIIRGFLDVKIKG
ncbi:SufD family Fe-S cluster assembly protein, partial [Candidatus Acetothermia bacterium]